MEKTGDKIQRYSKKGEKGMTFLLIYQTRKPAILSAGYVVPSRTVPV